MKKPTSSGNAEPYICAIKVEARTGGGEGTTPVTTACPEGRWEGENVLSWKVEVMIKKQKKWVYDFTLLRLKMVDGPHCC